MVRVLKSGVLHKGEPLKIGTVIETLTDTDEKNLIRTGLCELIEDDQTSDTDEEESGDASTGDTVGTSEDGPATEMPEETASKKAKTK